MVKLTGFNVSVKIYVNPDNINYITESPELDGTVIFFNADSEGGALHVKEDIDEVDKLIDANWRELYG